MKNLLSLKSIITFAVTFLLILATFILVVMFIVWRGHESEEPFLTQAKIEKQLAPLVEVSPKPSPTPEPVEVIIVGDMMFDRHIREKATAQGGYDFILEDLASDLQSADLVIGNLEGPVTDNPSKSVGSAIGSTNNYLFTFDPDITKFLNTYNFGLVNLGNNHILNFGQDGLAQTLYNLQQAGINYFGQTSPVSDPASESRLIQLGDASILFINHNQFIQPDAQPLLEYIREEREHVDLIIVYPHWGEEYQVTPTEAVRQLAHQLIDAGADLVIGSHSHVVGEIENYRGKRIYYSLGNFIFDQYFEPAVKRGLLVKVKIDPSNNTLKFVELPVQMNKDGTTTHVVEE